MEFLQLLNRNLPKQFIFLKNFSGYVDIIYNEFLHYIGMKLLINICFILFLVVLFSTEYITTQFSRYRQILKPHTYLYTNEVVNFQ